jgi:serine protease Do
VESATPHAVAPLGDSDSLRVGEWVCAIGNPLAYEHSVTVGVVSYIGRKLFDSSLDNYIQTDAAINFGNSGGPLINSRGEVIGINAAISSRASSIGFAVPVNQATAILPQLRDRGRVSRGFIGVALKDVDPDLQRSLNLGVSHGALVQDVTAGSPGERAGLRPYDLILAVDGRPISSNDELIREISARAPGSIAHVHFLRDGRSATITIKLAERPGREHATERPAENRDGQHPADSVVEDPTPLGLTVRDMDREFAQRYSIPADAMGVIVPCCQA